MGAVVGVVAEHWDPARLLPKRTCADSLAIISHGAKEEASPAQGCQ